MHWIWECEYGLGVNSVSAANCFTSLPQLPHFYKISALADRETQQNPSKQSRRPVVKPNHTPKRVVQVAELLGTSTLT